jgi:hypothetical protein
MQQEQQQLAAGYSYWMANARRQRNVLPLLGCLTF